MAAVVVELFMTPQMRNVGGALSTWGRLCDDDGRYGEEAAAELMMMSANEPARQSHKQRER